MTESRESQPLFTFDKPEKILVEGEMGQDSIIAAIRRVLLGTNPQDWEKLFTEQGHTINGIQVMARTAEEICNQIERQDAAQNGILVVSDGSTTPDERTGMTLPSATRQMREKGGSHIHVVDVDPQSSGFDVIEKLRANIDPSAKTMSAYLDADGNALPNTDRIEWMIGERLACVVGVTATKSNLVSQLRAHLGLRQLSGH